MDELSNDILLLIFDSLYEIKDKKTMTELNKFYNYLLSPSLRKFKLIKYLNNDYLKFYECLNSNNYSRDIIFMGKVVIKSFMNIPTIWVRRSCSMYDLRFIFELMMKGYGLDTNDIKIYNLHFYIHFYKRIINCIGDTRGETLVNIERCPYLFTLRRNPKFGDTSRNGVNFEWNSLVN